MGRWMNDKRRIGMKDKNRTQDIFWVGGWVGGVGWGGVEIVLEVICGKGMNDKRRMGMKDKKGV